MPFSIARIVADAISPLQWLLVEEQVCTALCKCVPRLCAYLYLSAVSAACPGRVFAIEELLLVSAHLIRAFDFSTFTLRKQLPDESSDLEVGAQLGADQGSVVEVVDFDGTVHAARIPAMENSGKSRTSFAEPRHDPI